MKRRWLQILKKAGKILLIVVGVFFLLDFIFPVPAKIEYAPLIEARDGTVLHSWLTKDQQWRMNARLDEITPELKTAIIFKEDRHFYHHPGIDLLAIGRALFNNVFHLKRTSGASTITMQVARMLEPKRRTYFNKTLEMFRAMQLELHYSKDEILQLYLNIVPYGSNIQGVKAASLLYFHKTPDQLSLAELTALSIIPNSPNSMVMGKDNARIIKDRNKWLSRFNEAKLFPANIIDDAIQEPLTAHRLMAPGHTPQLAWRVRRNYGNKPEIRTTLNASMQRKAEEIVSNYAGALKLRNIYNASVLLVDNRTQEVLVYIGSADFNDKLHNGQVDGVCMLRSPGSTLKPLLYGLSFDNGFITPKTIIADVHANFNGYTPENYDLGFRGNIAADDALRNSLNIPAVKLLDHMGTASFINALSKSGFESVAKKKKKLGLSMILGGCSVCLEELTALYASFANDGNYSPLRYVLQDSLWMQKKDTTAHIVKTKHKDAYKVLSPEANYMLTNILTELHRPDLPNMHDNVTGIPHIAWKTGTSYGRKDAWSIGYNKNYTIGVWVGNFSGKGVPDLNGAGTATPLLFDLFNALDKQASEDWVRVPKSMAYRYVCSHSGKVPGEHCSEQIMDQYIPGISSNEHCNHIRETWLTADGKYTYCTSCLPATGYMVKLLPYIAPELVAYYETYHIEYDKQPPHNPACTRLFNGEAPTITTLTNGMTYLVTDRQKQNLQLACTAANDVEKVYWYVNNKFLTCTKVGEKAYFLPQNTMVKISCADDKGRYVNIDIRVKFL